MEGKKSTEMEVLHVVILTFPAQGHVKPLLMLADLLSHAGFQVTFVTTDHNYDRLRRYTDDSAFHRRGSLRFMSIPDGLPPEHPRSGLQIVDLFLSLGTLMKPKFKELVDSISRETAGRWSPPTCIIADGFIAFAVEVAEELEIPIISFRTNSASCTWANFGIPTLIEQGEIPLSGDNMDHPITCIPGMESLLRRRDLPSICRIPDLQNPIFQFYLNLISTMTRASALILNTFEDLESPIIDKLHSLFPKVYTIGPLHALLKAQIPDQRGSSDSGTLRVQDRTCLTWLDSQSSKSVLYVSFGSLAWLSHDQLMEVWHGLVNSGKAFLWVIRSDLIGEEDRVHETPQELLVGTKERGCIVDWAPQEEVLAHRAVGGFLTHSGWNSTIESISAGVPMVCWPHFADQQVNSRCVSDMWKIGVDIKDTCDRSTVEKMVRDIMEDVRGELLKSAAEIARMAHDSVMEGGSSQSNLEKLIEYIKSINSARCSSGSNK